MFDNSDEYDFTPADSSKLSALFGNVGSDELNSSLMYTAPKQPSNQRVSAGDDLTTSKSKSQSTVLIAKVVSLWKLENKEYKALGKHGLAVIGVVDLNLFEIIGYKEKNNVILRTKLNESLLFYHQKGNFSSFYDDDSKNWLIKFQNDDQKQFCEVLKKCGAQILDSPQKSTEVDSPKPELHPKPKFDAESEELLSDSSGSQRRADILSRMAKMGQQILPKPPQMNNCSDISDSEFEENKIDRKSPRKPKRHVGNPTRGENVSSNSLDNGIVPSSTNSICYSPNLNHSLLSPMMYAQPMNYAQPMSSEGLNHFIISQNTELKMNVATLSAKLDNVLSSCILDKKTDDTALKSKIKALELKCLNLQEDLTDYKNKYNILDEKYKELSGKECEALSERNLLINGLESEISKLKLDLTVAEEQLGDFENLKRELQQSEINLKDCEKTVEIQKLKLKDFEDFYEQNKNNKDLQVTIGTLNETIANLKLKLKDFEEYFRKTESEKQDRQKSNNEKVNLLSDMIKMHMNEMYQSVLESFGEGASVPFSEVQSAVAKNLKGTTFQVIEDLKSIVNEGENSILNDQ